MSANEKASSLLSKYRTIIRQADKFDYNLTSDEIYLAKKCVLIMVNDIISELTEEISPSVHGFRHNYWIEVRTELEKL